MKTQSYQHRGNHGNPITNVIEYLLHLFVQVIKSWIKPSILPFYGLILLYTVLQLIPGPGLLKGPTVTVAVKTLPIWYLVFYVQIFKSLPFYKNSDDTDHSNDQNDEEKEERYKQSFTIGLILSSMGDALLIFPSTFTPGVFLYGAAHVMYIAGMGNRRGRSLFAWLVYPLTIGGFLTIALWIGSLPMTAIIFLYYLLLTTVLFYAIASFETRLDTKTLLALIGAMSFVLSDTLIANDRWVIQLPFREILVLSTYYFAQFNLALSV